MATELEQLRKKPRIVKEGGIWSVKYLRVWDSEESWTDWAQEYKRNVVAAHAQCLQWNNAAADVLHVPV